jgi:hypothetical protein
MIKLVQEGRYELIGTQHHIRMLVLQGLKVFAWIYAEGIGELLVTSRKSHKVDHILATGRYRLYEVKDVPKLTDLVHLELHVGNGIWQGYLLPTGLPNDKKKRNRIISTHEIITKSLP